MKMPREMVKVPPGEQHPKHFNFVKLHFDRPSPTVPTWDFVLWHPKEPRVLTLSECRRICTFPDDFILTGTREEQWKRMGNSVPPLLMKAVAGHIKATVLDKSPPFVPGVPPAPAADPVHGDDDVRF
jgi:DNA (cytosine-5)-methyltransferase 1